MENLWARFLPQCLGLKRTTKYNKVWKSPSSIHSLLASAFISEKSFRFDSKSLVGEDGSREKARGTTSDLQVGCVMRTTWIYSEEQADSCVGVNSFPSEHSLHYEETDWHEPKAQKGTFKIWPEASVVKPHSCHQLNYDTALHILLECSETLIINLCCAAVVHAIKTPKANTPLASEELRTHAWD